MKIAKKEFTGEGKIVIIYIDFLLMLDSKTDGFIHRFRFFQELRQWERIGKSTTLLKTYLKEHLLRTEYKLYIFLLFHIIALLSGRDAGEGGRGGGEDITTTTFRKQPAIYHVFYTRGGKFRQQPNSEALFEILSFSIIQCIFLYHDTNSSAVYLQGFSRRHQVGLAWILL